MTKKLSELREQLEDGNTPNPGSPWAKIIGAIIVIIVLIVLGFMFLGGDSPESAVSAATNTPEPPPTDTPEPLPTDTPEPPPTDTPEPPPTDTPEPPPTDTPEPVEEPTATNTIEPTPVIPMLTGGGKNQNNAALYSCPNQDSAQLGVFLEVGSFADEIVGRSANQNWIQIEYQETLGWVSASFVTLENIEVGELDEIDAEDACVGEVSETPDPPDFATPNPGGDVAYWYAYATSTSVGEGRWQTVFSVKVPQGGTYTFKVGEFDTTWAFQRSEETADFYLITVAGMSCDGALVNDLIATRNGAPLLIVQDGSEGVNPSIFIEAPEC